MANFTLGSSNVLGEAFSDKAAEILGKIENGDTLYLDRVQDAAVVTTLLNAIDKHPKLLPSTCKPGNAPPVW